MVEVVIFGAIFVVGFGGIVVAALLLGNRLLKRTVYERHQALEELLSSSEVPHMWREPYEARIERLAADPARASDAARLRDRARDYYVAKLDGLVRYVQKTTLVESEEARREMLDRLQEIRGAWKSG